MTFVLLFKNEWNIKKTNKRHGWMGHTHTFRNIIQFNFLLCMNSKLSIVYLNVNLVEKWIGISSSPIFATIISWPSKDVSAVKSIPVSKKVSNCCACCVP